MCFFKNLDINSFCGSYPNNLTTSNFKPYCFAAPTSSMPQFNKSDNFLSSKWNKVKSVPQTNIDYGFHDFLSFPSERCVSTVNIPNISISTHSKSNMRNNLNQTDPNLVTFFQPDLKNNSKIQNNSSNTCFPNSNISLQSKFTPININGIFILHLLAGKGLNSSYVLIRDLYCVIEMDSIRKARSMIRTSTSYFEWNEVFELDINDHRFLAILLYQWDPKTKHRLCFYGGLDIQNLLTRLSQTNQSGKLSAECSNMTQTNYSEQLTTKGQCLGETQNRAHDLILSPSIAVIPKQLFKIALQLEPRGVLYLELGWIALDKLFHRNQTLFIESNPTTLTNIDHLLFGVSIDELIERERVIYKLTKSYIPKLKIQSSVYKNMDKFTFIPFFIKKCVEEIDKRGLDVVGIYQLAGSVWMKLQVRELFNRVTKFTLKALVHEDLQSLNDIIELVDLSAQRIPDIHAVTGKYLIYHNNIIMI